MEENERLLQLYQQKQNHWKEISSNLVGRTDNAAKNQFFALMRKGLRKACRTIGYTSNTIKINGLKPKVLLDFFQLNQDFVVEGKLTHVNVAEFIHHYALADIPENIFEQHNQPLVNEIMAYLTKMKSPQKREVHGSQEFRRQKKAQKDRKTRQKAPSSAPPGCLSSPQVRPRSGSLRSPLQSRS